MDGFEKGYSFYAESFGPAFAAQMGDAWVGEVETAIETLERDLNKFSASAKTIDTLSGDIAEIWHADTFNIDAVLKGAKLRAEVPRVTDFASPDIVVKAGDAVISKYQVKYYQDGAHSAMAQAKSFLEASKTPGTSSGAVRAIAAGTDQYDAVYKGMKRLIPEGQGVEAVRALDRKIYKEAVTRPEQVGRLEETRASLSESVRQDGVESKTLSREASKELARDVKQGKVELASKGVSTEELVKLDHVMRSSLKVGVTAALIAMAVKAAPIICAAVHDLASGEGADVDQLLSDTGDVAKFGFESFVSGTISAALTESIKSGLLGEAVKGVSPGVVALATVLAGIALKDGVKLAKGEISQAQFAEDIFQKSYYAVFALGGGTLVQGLIPIPALGYMLGSLVGSLIGGVTYEIGSSVFVGLCVDRGMTFFGLVEQDYELPDWAIEDLGLEVFKYESFQPESSDLELFEPESFGLNRLAAEQFEVRYPRRGLIAFNKVGYV